MKNSSILQFLVAVALLVFGEAAVDATEYDLYYLGGQSNMDGYGKVADLPEALIGPVDGVMIFHGNSSADGKPVDGRGTWAELRPGHGAGYGFDGETAKYSDRFGVELTFATTLKKLDPTARIAIIKYSRGGTSIDREAGNYAGAWDPDFPGTDGIGINQYDHFLATIRNATSVADIDGDGETDTLVPKGIVWMQGESDAYLSEEIATRYEAHLTRLMNLMRAALLTDDLPVVIGRISDSGRDEDEKDGMVWNYGKTVRAAQAAFVDADGHAAFVTSTEGYGYSDPYHYDSAGYIDLGREFAAAVHGLRTQTSSLSADPDPLRFQTQIDAFSNSDKKERPPGHPLLFVGSSSIRRWPTSTSFPDCDSLNRGFGGAHISDVQYFYDQTVLRYRPKAIVFYAGDNDVAFGKGADQVFEDFRSFVESVRRDLQGTPIYFIAIKPSGSRWELWDTMQKANALVHTWAGSQPDLHYIDVATPMIGIDGAPREELFVDDRLHLNDQGYDLWDSIVRPHLAFYCGKDYIQ